MENIVRKSSHLSYRYRTQYKKGKDLLVEISHLNLMRDLAHLSSYKFYDELICEIAHVAKTYGAATSKTLAKLRHSLSMDLQIEKKTSSAIYEAYFQFLLASGLTLLINIFATNILNFEIDILFICAALIYNFIGIAFFRFLIKRLMKRFLSPVSKALHSFLIFKLMYDVGAPIGDLISRSRINQLAEINRPFTKDLFSRLAALIEMKQEQGDNIADDLNSIEIGLWNEYKSQHESLLGRIKVFKFIWLVIFFFVPYIANFFRLINYLSL